MSSTKIKKCLRKLNLLLLGAISGCGLFQKELPAMKVDFSTDKLYITGKSLFIDSIAMVDNNSVKPWFALKISRVDPGIPADTLALKSPGIPYEKSGNFDTACAKKDIRILIFVKDHQDKAKLLYYSAYYYCGSNSSVTISPEGTL